VVFPSEGPSQATGPGAILWSAAGDCPGGEGARVARIGAGGVPSAATIPRTTSGRLLAPPGPLAIAGGPHGQVVIAGASPAGPAGDLLVEGTAAGPFSALTDSGSPSGPPVLASAYLGDVALAAPVVAGHGAERLRVRVQRHYSRGFGPAITFGAGAGGPVRALTLALDYRSDALAVWAQQGAIYARELPASGVGHPIERLAPAGADVRIAALLSDDNRAIVAWSEQREGQTSVYLDRSSAGVRFGAPRLLERFGDPDGLPSPDGSPTLVRLSSESVMMAWAGSAGGHWVVRTAAVDDHGLRLVDTIATPGADALLEDLAPGPDGDALVAWTEPQQAKGGRPDLADRAIFAARGIEAYPGRTIFGEPEQVAPPGPNGGVSVALDPDSDRAVAAWLGAGATIEYAIGTPGITPAAP
jgi:hypothetical protein